MPILIGTLWFSTNFVVLGFSTSREEVDILSISKPLTYAFPEEICKLIISSAGVLPFCVVWLSKYIPLLPTLSFNDSFTSSENGFI